jgi:Cys-tRNA(Pro)/Cys-tRNA(Cys) deacylase
MTPGILAAKKAGEHFTIHEYDHDPSAPSFGMEAAEKLGVPPERVFKTLWYALTAESWPWR